ADANQNNGGVSQKPAVTDSTGAEGPRQPWSPANTADPDEATPRPHLARLFSRDAPGREDNTFKERPSESDELQTIQEHSGAASENPDAQRATRKPTLTHTHTRNRSSRTKMASASGSGQAAFGLGRRKKSPGLLDQIGKFFGGDKKRKGKVRKHSEL
uniref:Myelin basic protein n=1 Tax=Tetraodon nigroviridis TaxID=99883 RepID=H3DP13_TETNG